MKLLLTGDYFYDTKNKADDLNFITQEFINYNYVVLNYEGSLKSNNLTKKAVNLSMSTESLNIPKNTILCLSNNHILDYGIEGYKKTISSLKDNNLQYFGVESQKQKFDNYKILEHNNTKVCIASFGWANEECILSQSDSPGNVDFTKENIELFFENNKKLEYDKLFIYVHYGYEYEYFPLPLHVDLFRYMIELGADFVYSSHSHIVQPYEIYKEKYIFYGLGNFYFASRRDIYPEQSDKGLLLELSITNKKIEVIPKYIKYDRNLGKSLLLEECDYFERHKLKINSFDEYSKNYKTQRTRKKNPRPILYKDSDFSNMLKFQGWKLIVDITGYLKIRQVVKKILGW